MIFRQLDYFPLSFDIIRSCFDFALILLKRKYRFTSWTRFEGDEFSHTMIKRYKIIFSLIEVLDTKIIADLEDDLV